MYLISEQHLSKNINKLYDHGDIIFNSPPFVPTGMLTTSVAKYNSTKDLMAESILKKLSTLWSDNALEFLSVDFRSYLYVGAHKIFLPIFILDIRGSDPHPSKIPWSFHFRDWIFRMQIVNEQKDYLLPWICICASLCVCFSTRIVYQNHSLMSYLLVVIADVLLLAYNLTRCGAERWVLNTEHWICNKFRILFIHQHQHQHHHHLAFLYSI